MLFEFATATRIIFGAGALSQLGEIAASMGKSVLLTTNLQKEHIAPVIELLSIRGLYIVPYFIDGEPTVKIVADGLELSRENLCDLVIGIGGGSAIDTGKAVAGLTTNPGDVYDYLEVVGKGQPITKQPIPMIAVPSTAGTGAEVTRNAVIGVPEHHVKVSLRHPWLLPKLALIDPELTYNLPPGITASTGVDALTQLIEPFVSIKANPLTDAICREGMNLIAHALYQAYETGDTVSREKMSMASLFGGLALANSGLGVVHGFASVLGGMYPIPHGIICARFLPYVMETNLHSLQAKSPNNPTLARFQDVARLLTGNPAADAAEGIAWVLELCTRLKIPRLVEYPINSQDFQTIIEKTTKASSTRANPVQLTYEELWQILQAAV